MGKYKRPLKRSVHIALILFTTVLCLVLGVMAYQIQSRTLYRQYEHYIENLLRYAASNIDVDDLAKCIGTGEKSEKFHGLQSFLDNLRENADMHFMYVIIPLNTNETDNIQNVIAAVTRQEYETMADQLVQLNQLTGDSYSPETAAKYLSAYESGGLSFFEEVSQWGDDYTGLLPLVDSSGNRVAALCMDVDIRQIHTELRATALGAVAVTMILGALFMIAFARWINLNVTQPIRKLESAVVGFAERSHGRKDPEALVLEMPEIHTDNEVESLANAIAQMSGDMRDYVKDLLSVEKRARSAEREAESMTRIALSDALTGVKSKMAYVRCVDELNREIAQGRGRFAIVMMDMDRLKQINDLCGHENGDRYIVATCRLFCGIYSHSPVYRYGGDEFVAVLRGADYDDRDRLFAEMIERFDALRQAENLQPWERCSAAVGMAEYTGADGEDAEQVFRRADAAMYANKKKRQAN